MARLGRVVQSRIEQSKAVQSRAEQSRAGMGQGRAGGGQLRQLRWKPLRASEKPRSRQAGEDEKERNRKEIILEKRI